MQAIRRKARPVEGNGGLKATAETAAVDTLVMILLLKVGLVVPGILVMCGDRLTIAKH
jgi:hypothetical protein